MPAAATTRTSITFAPRARCSPPGGRLAAVTSAHCVPGDRAWARAFERMNPPARVAFSVAIDGRAYARRGTSFHSRLTVLDRDPEGRASVPVDARAFVADAASLLAAVTARVPPRLPLGPRPVASGATLDLFDPAAAPVRRPVGPKAGPKPTPKPAPAKPRDFGPVAELRYEAGPFADEAGDATAAAGPFAPWRPSTVRIAGAIEHPTPLVQSGAMAAVPHPKPTYRPMLPERVIAEGLLSDAQAESVVLGGQAHDGHLSALYRIGEGWETVHRVDGERERPVDSGATADANERLSAPVRLRKGWMLGDGTGCGKGRQVAALILDQWLRGRKRALWLSQSDKLLEDARRDWTALGGAEADVIPLAEVRQGAEIPQSEGILFATYATLRSPARQGKRSRLEQVVGWLAGSLDEVERHAYQGVVVFDEAHAMANAAGSKGSRGEIAPSQQGRAGLRLQNALPDARITYVSATGATTVPGLAYARRLGLWGSGETPFENRSDFIAAMEAGGVAALEVVARDLKALGLYQARALSYDGVEVDILEHPLSPEQRRIYDAYAGAFKVIHANIEAALKATGIVEGNSTLNRNAKSAAYSAFEGAKQRFFGHLLTSMKCPTLIRAIEADLEAGRSAVVQLVSTGEALMERRIAEIPPSEWDDLSIDLTPREYVLDFLAHAFPVQLHEPFTDEEGHLMSRPVKDKDGHPVLSQEALAARDALMEKLAALPPVPAALDQILHHFGADEVAEVTGRSRRVLRIVDSTGERLTLKTRPASASLAETAAFMDTTKRILVFSMAGGTGRSYHADLGCANTERRVHYLLEPGWRADQAIQGLGRTHRTHQASAPLFRPLTTDVKGERRFIATIARRLDSLGAITRGQRDSQTAMGGGDATLFRASDNLESAYAKTALRQLYLALCRGAVPEWPLDRFEEATGLKLTYDGTIREDLPPMPRFLNRLLALPIDEQNALFAELETRIEAAIEQAVEAGTFERGVETIHADGLAVASREPLFEHEGSGAITEMVEVARRDRLEPFTAEAALRRRDEAPSLRRRRAAHGERALGPRRARAPRPLAHARRRRGREAGAASAPRRARHGGGQRARRLQLGGVRRARVACALGGGDRRAPLARRVAVLARRGAPPAALGPAPGPKHARAPARHRRGRSPHRARVRRGRGRGASRRLRARGRARAHPFGDPRVADGQGRLVHARERLAARPPARDGRAPDRARRAGRRRSRPGQAHGLHHRDRLVANARLRPRRGGARAPGRALAAPGPRGRGVSVASDAGPVRRARRPFTPQRPAAPRGGGHYPRREPCPTTSTSCPRTACSRSVPPTSPRTSPSPSASSSTAWRASSPPRSSR